MAWIFSNWFRGGDKIQGSSSLPEKKSEGHPAYRKCPKCGERDFRISDRQRARPEIYGSRIFRVKWLCLACGMRESEEIEESG